MLQRESTRLKTEEIAHAEEELAKVKEKGDVFKLTGNILIKSAAEEVKKDLRDERDTLEARNKALDRQEKLLRDRLTEAQTKIQGMLKAQGGGQ